MGVFGTDPLGTDLSLFGGPSVITVRGVLPVSNNSVTVVFDIEPKTLDPQAFTTATNHNNYTLTPIDPTYVATDGTVHIPTGEVVPTRSPLVATAVQDDNDPNQIIVSFDSAVQPHVRYTLTISILIKGVDGEVFNGPNEFNFRAPLLSPRLVLLEASQERYRDFDWIVNPRKNELGQVFRSDDTGDIAIQSGAVSLRKRIYRRIFTDPGGLAWNPGYGVGIRVKAMAKAGNLQELSNLIADQILQEPDVTNAGVETFMNVTTQGAFLNISARVKTRNAQATTFQFSEPI